MAFLAGIAFAYFGLNYRLSNVENKLTDLFVTMLSYQEIAEVEDVCDSKEYVWLLGEELDRIGERLSMGDYPPYLLKYYALMEATHMKIVERIRRECNEDVHWIIFFYGEGCPMCDVQGNVLTYLKSKYPESVFIYAMKVSLDSPITRTLKIKYGVKSVPTLVIDGKTYEGLLGLDELEEIISTSEELPAVEEDHGGSEDVQQGREEKESLER